MGEIRLDKMSGAGPGFYPALFLESGMKKQQNDFLNGSILPSLLRFAGPVLLALFLQAMYGAVDLIVVGKFAGTADISAVSTGSQAMQLVTSLLVGLTTGVTVLLGQKIGEGKPDEAGRALLPPAAGAGGGLRPHDAVCAHLLGRHAVHRRVQRHRQRLPRARRFQNAAHHGRHRVRREYLR